MELGGSSRILRLVQGPSCPVGGTSFVLQDRSPPWLTDVSVESRMTVCKLGVRQSPVVVVMVQLGLPHPTFWPVWGEIYWNWVSELLIILTWQMQFIHHFIYQTRGSVNGDISFHRVQKKLDIYTWSSGFNRLLFLWFTGQQTLNANEQYVLDICGPTPRPLHFQANTEKGHQSGWVAKLILCRFCLQNLAVC